MGIYVFIMSMMTMVINMEMYGNGHENGKVYLYKKVEHGKEIGQKIWRADGKIYANYLYKESGLLGLTGGKLCRTVKGEDGKTKSY
jgi:hypothetical protein